MGPVGIEDFVDYGLLTPEMMKALVNSVLEREPIDFDKLDQILTNVFSTFSKVLLTQFNANESTSKNTIDPKQAPYVLGELLSLLKTQVSNFLGKKIWAAKLELVEQKIVGLGQTSDRSNADDERIVVYPQQEILLNNGRSLSFGLVRNQSVPCVYQLEYCIV